MKQKSFTPHLLWGDEKRVYPAPYKKGAGFTVIELLIVLAIIILISGFILVSLRSIKERGRDARRFQEINQIVKALQLYWADYGYYPPKTCPCQKGWEASDKEPSQFMEYLAPYLSEIPLDPINRRVDDFKFFGPRPENYFYAYKNYDPPSYCPEIKRPFVILAISNLESYVPPNLPEEGMPLPPGIKLPRVICGDPGPDGICTVAEYEADQCRDWSQEFDYSVMLIE